MAFTTDAAYPQFLWMAILAIIFGFTYAFGIGANDVANAFASSVAARSLTLGQAIIVASTFEFLGAVLLGQSVTGTIRNNVLNTEYYEDDASLLMYGMLTSLILATVFLLSATALEFPVSTTHTILAAIIGFSIASMGFQSVNWMATGKIFISWIAAPSISAIISFFFFYTTRRFVLVHDDSFSRAILAFPLVIFVGVSVNVAFILLKSQKKIAETSDIDNFGVTVVLPASVGGGFLCALIFYLFVGPCLVKRVERQHDEEEEAVREEQERQVDADVDEVMDKADAADITAEISADISETGNVNSSESENSEEPNAEEPNAEEPNAEEPNAEEPNSEDEEEEPVEPEEPVDPPRPTRSSIHASIHASWDYFAEHTYRQDLAAMSFSESKRASQIWEQSEAHDPKVERLFSYLQVFTATLTSFAHGANDVANAIAPVAAVIQIYHDGNVVSKSPVPKWILALGGIGISFGFIFFGYKIIKAVGYKLTCISPSRGFCIELATALAVSTASYLGIPVSSTQCLVGATVGAGVASGGFKNVQWLYFGRITFGWVTVFFTTLFACAGVFAYCVFGPSLVDSEPVA